MGTRGGKDRGREKSEGIREQDLLRQDEARVVRYRKPTMRRDRHVLQLARTGSMLAAIQVFRRGGGEERLHAHPNLDGFWWVIRGQVAFYTAGHELVAEIGPQEGVFIPPNFPYYFVCVGDEDVEILQVEAFLTRGERLRTVFLDDKTFDANSVEVSYF